MTTIQIIVTFAGLMLMGLTAWYFWFFEKKAVQVTSEEGDVQEVFITVKGGYSPDLILVKAGKPVKLDFQRQETASCSETVIFPDFQKSAKLPPGETVPIEFTPDKPGEYQFNCQMGMSRGKLVVE